MRARIMHPMTRALHLIRDVRLPGEVPARDYRGEN